MHFSWNIDLGQVVTWVVAIGTLVYKLGTFTETLRSLSTNLIELKTDFKAHVEDDQARFDGVQTTVNQILVKGVH